ncbi:MAG: cob(I)yrinic acid a,c-diamide adenosyltransferase [Chlorobiaceae bacterium]|nr:cob(I)yrinic acid a,c-diamide adenosyltransferase [Chlorobiales bacterium]NTV25749.1 cob(I)yrinic acid a,c-diamide adenosyltransferase [Chlorobiaceae bacterium]
MEQKRVLLFTGNGKGKSTAAFGMLARALGHGMNTRVIQFVKAQDGVGEMLFFTRFENVTWDHYGKGFLPSNPESPIMESHRKAASAGFEEALEALVSDEYDFVLLDEVCFALSKGIIPIEPLIDAIRKAPEGKIIVLTGRNAPQELIDIADTVTEMRMVKHGYEQGLLSQAGVEE